MTKIILLSTLFLSFLAASPALAVNSTSSSATSSAKGIKLEKLLEVKNKIEVKKQEIKEKLTEKKEEIKEEGRELVKSVIVNQAIVARGELIRVSGINLPAELVVKVMEVKPEKRLATSTTSTLPSVGQNITVKVDEKTNFVRKFWGKNSLEELTVGDKLMVVAKVNDDGSYQGLMVKDESIYFKQKFIAGTVNSTSSGAVNIKVGEKEVVVNISDETKLMKPNTASTTLSDLTVGDKILVKGVYNTNNDSIFARTIRLVKDKIRSFFGGR